MSNMNKPPNGRHLLMMLSNDALSKLTCKSTHDIRLQRKQSETTQQPPHHKSDGVLFNLKQA